jgi:hypothetical protein
MQSLQKPHGVLRPHEALANQEIPYSGAKEPLDIGAGVNPAFGDQNLAGAVGPPADLRACRIAARTGDSACKAYGGRNVSLKSRQVAVVYADQPRPGFCSGFELTFIMHLYEGVQTDTRAQ